jgi:hypothetical protein
MTPSNTRVSALCAMCCLLAALHSPPAKALTFLVGGFAVPSVCDFNNLQAAIDAAASNPGEDFIRVANDQSYNALALTIGQQDLTITGGYANCSAALPADALPTGSTTLNGAGGAAAPVIRISGGGVRTLANLQIRNGDHGACGGGISFNGHGVLGIANTGIAQNTASAGGGICFEASASPAILSIGADVTINNNTANSGGGGGIWIGGPARLSMVSDRTLVAFNAAPNDDGGGVHIRWPAAGDIGSPGLGNLGVIYANEARRGGGVAAVAADGSDGNTSCVRFFTTVNDRPVRLQENRASVAGGGLYLTPNATTGIGGARVDAQMFDFRIDGNTAPNGPALFLDGDSGLFTYSSFANLNVPPAVSLVSCAQPPLAEVGRVPCTVAAACNRIEGNRAQDIAGNPTNGNVIEVQDGSVLVARSATIVNNVGTRLISGSGEDATWIQFHRSALVGNTLTQEIYRAFNEDVLRLSDVTIAGNAIGNSHVLRFDSDSPDSSLVNVLIDQPGKLSMARPGLVGFSNSWVVASDTTTLKPDPTVLALRGSGRFVDPIRGDYRLRIGHEAVDYAPTPSGPGFENDGGDLDGRPRQIDLGEVSANDRIRDLGPYERQSHDRWLPNGDFVSDLRLWSNPNPAHSIWSALNAPGGAGGSLDFTVPADQVGPTERRTALTQCFNLPSSGEYQIMGRALVGGGMFSDYPVLNWRLRYDSEDCTGAESASGDRFFGRSSSAWQPLTTPLFIAVDPAQWTWNTTIEVRLEAAQNQGSPTATSLFARFDEIEINKQTIAIFADGFE